MNVLTILRSVEELLYEVMSWLLFYPLTLWMTIRRPLTTMQYSDQEQRDKPEKQYLETLSPPLFLVLSILLAHGVELAFGWKTPHGTGFMSQLLTQNEQTLLGFRALIFGLPGLLFAVLILKLKTRKIDRESLRMPFFAQCYLSGATAILVSLGSTGIRYPSEVATVVGLAVILISTVWYLVVEWRWIRKETQLGPVKAGLFTLSAFAGAMAVAGTTASLIA